MLENKYIHCYIVGDDLFGTSDTDLKVYGYQDIARVLLPEVRNIERKS